MGTYVIMFPSFEMKDYIMKLHELQEIAINVRQTTGATYKFPPIMEDAFYNEIIRLLGSDWEVHKQFVIQTEVLSKSDFLMSDDDELVSARRYYDIVIIHKSSGKKHILELKHQVSTGTAIDSIAIFAEEIESLKRACNTECTPFSFIICDYLPVGEYSDGKGGVWKKKEIFVQNQKFRNRLNSYAQHYKCYTMALHNPTTSDLIKLLTNITRAMNVSWSHKLHGE